MIFQRYLKSPNYLVSDDKNEIDGFLMIYLDKYYVLDNGKKDDSNPIIQLFSLDDEITKSHFIIILLQIIIGFLNIYASNLKPCSHEIMINDNFNIQIIGLDNLTFCDDYSERDCIEVLNDIFRNINNSFKETDIYKTFFNEGGVIRNNFQYIVDISKKINELIRLNVYLQAALEHGLPGDLGHGPGDLGHGPGEELSEELSEKSEELSEKSEELSEKSEELKDKNNFSFNNTMLKTPINKLKKIKKKILNKQNTRIIYNLYKNQKDKNEKYLLRRLLDKPDSNHLENYLYYEYFLSDESVKELEIQINESPLIIMDVTDITYIQKLIVLYVFYARSIKNTLYQDLLKKITQNSFDDIAILPILRKIEPIQLTDLIDTLYNLYQIEDKEKFKKEISDFIMSEDVKYPSDLIHKSKLRNNSICNTIYMKPDKNKFSLFSNTIFDIDETKIHDFQKYIDSIAPLIIQKQTKKIKNYIKKSKKSKKSKK